MLIAVTTDQIAVKAAPGRQHARDAPAQQSFAMQLRHDLADMQRLHLLQVVFINTLQQDADIPAVTFRGQRRQAPLMREMTDKFGSQRFRFAAHGLHDLAVLYH